ncbi:unnamed protein product [Closterium sp. Naga37s-1]|nr:unnamed protein product [Closterium sp. Naga37s-1]
MRRVMLAGSEPAAVGSAAGAAGAAGAAASAAAGAGAAATGAGSDSALLRRLMDSWPDVVVQADMPADLPHASLRWLNPGTGQCDWEGGVAALVLRLMDSWPDVIVQGDMPADLPLASLRWLNTTAEGRWVEQVTGRTGIHSLTPLHGSVTCSLLSSLDCSPSCIPHLLPLIPPSLAPAHASLTCSRSCLPHLLPLLPPAYSSSSVNPPRPPIVPGLTAAVRHQCCQCKCSHHPSPLHVPPSSQVSLPPCATGAVSASAPIIPLPSTSPHLPRSHCRRAPPVLSVQVLPSSLSPPRPPIFPGLTAAVRHQCCQCKCSHHPSPLHVPPSSQVSLPPCATSAVSASAPIIPLPSTSPHLPRSHCRRAPPVLSVQVLPSSLSPPRPPIFPGLTAAVRHQCCQCKCSHHPSPLHVPPSSQVSLLPCATSAVSASAPIIPLPSTSPHLPRSHCHLAPPVLSVQVLPSSLSPPRPPIFPGLTAAVRHQCCQCKCSHHPSPLHVPPSSQVSLPPCSSSAPGTSDSSTDSSSASSASSGGSESGRSAEGWVTQTDTVVSLLLPNASWSLASSSLTPSESCSVRALETACLGGVLPSAGVAAIMRTHPASTLSRLPHSTAIYLEVRAAREQKGAVRWGRVRGG